MSHFCSTHTIDEVAARLQTLGCEPAGRGTQRMAYCPAHAEGSTKSLSFGRGASRPVIVNCFAGCSPQDIDDVLSGRRQPVPRDPAAPRLPRRSRHPGSWQAVARYAYHDEEGHLLHTKVRLEPATQPAGGHVKSFRWEDAQGAPHLDQDRRRVLYNLPAVATARPKESLILLVEGEKDADRINGEAQALGVPLIATCTDSGASGWRPEYAQWLAGQWVVILPDNDDAGREFAQAAAADLYGVAFEVHVLELPDLKEKGDTSDWLNAGGELQDLIYLAIYEAESWTPAADTREAADATDEQEMTGQWPGPPAAAQDADYWVSTLRYRGEASSVSLAPSYEGEGGYRENARKKHDRLVREGKQIEAELVLSPVRLLEGLSPADYKRWARRMRYQRKQGERRAWKSWPLADGTYTVFHNGDDDGDPILPSRPALYKLLEHLVDHLAEGKRPAAAGDWGKAYQGTRGDGREKSEEAIRLNARWHLIAAEAKSGPIAPYKNMRQMSHQSIYGLASHSTRPKLLGMLRAEHDGLGRKSVMEMLLQKIGANSIQLLGRCSIRKAAAALGMKLNKGLRGTVKMDLLQAYDKLSELCALRTKTGADAWRVFREWWTYNRKADARPTGEKSADYEHITQETTMSIICQNEPRRDEPVTERPRQKPRAPGWRQEVLGELIPA